MDTPEDAARFARLLRELKGQSRRSYEDLSRRSLTSRSALHRYCTGQVLPPDVDTVTRIANACGAGTRDKNKLISAWLTASRERTESSATSPAAEHEGTPGAGRPPAEDGALTLNVAPGPAALALGSPHPAADRPAATADPPRGLPKAAAASLRPSASVAETRRVITAMVLLATCVFAFSVSSSAPGRHPAGTDTAAPPIPGVTWTLNPRPLSPETFGVTTASDTGLMPTFKVGSVRFWDSGTRWASLQPRRDEFDWATLDRLVGAAERAGLERLFVFGGTPAWAAPNGSLTAYGDGSRAAAPDDLRDWDRFVSALAQRYRGRIDAYELWVLGNDRHFFQGSPETLVEMTRRASRIIKGTDPEATIVCPGMGRLWEPSGQRVLERFAELGGYRHCDAAGIKLYQRRATDPPETMLEALRQVDIVMHKAGVHPQLWSTGTTYDIAVQEQLDEATAANHAVRFYLTGMFGRNFALRRMYFYSWGSTRVPIVLQPPGGAPTRAALAIERLQRWLARARIRSCGHGLPAGLPQNAWQCEFTFSGSPGGRAIIRWTDIGRADTVAPPGATHVQDMNGRSIAIRPGENVPVAQQPALISLTGGPTPE